MTTYARNKKANYNYKISDRYEAGIELHGWEVKGIIAGQAQLVEAYVSINQGEAWLKNCHIKPEGNVDPKRIPDPRRPRRLLLHAEEIRKLGGKIKQTGMTLVVTAMYRKHGKIKVEVCLAKGKRQYDKRQALKEKDIQRNRDR